MPVCLFRVLLKITDHYQIALIQMLRDGISRCCEKYTRCVSGFNAAESSAEEYKVIQVFHR